MEEEEEDEEQQQQQQQEDFECMICQSPEDAKRMLLCDGCDDAFHMRCLDPPLDAIPEGDWYCSECMAIREMCCQVCTSPPAAPSRACVSRVCVCVCVCV
jgi:PHD-finger